MDTYKNQPKSFSDYMYILFKWRKFIFINLLVVGIISILIAFLLRKEYRAVATVMIAPESQMNFGGLTSVLGGGKSTMAALGAKAFGVSNISEDILLGIMNSRTALVKVIQEFNLMDYYKIKDQNFDKALKAFQADFSADVNEHGMIEVRIVHKNPKIAADIANYLVRITDSLNIVYNMEQSRSNRLFLEKRYNQNVEDLRKAEEELYKFQKKYGIVAVPEQLEVSVKAAAEIEGMLTKKEIEAYFIKQQFGENSPQYQGVAAELEVLRKKVQELKNSSNLSSQSNVFFAFKQMPEIAIQYLRTYRDVQIQQAILEVVLPMYEQAKVEEQKSIPSLLLIDKATPPQLKYSPKRSIIVLGTLFLALFIMIPFVFVGEKYLLIEQFSNPLQERFASFIIKLKNIYHF
ncbi:MAG TPA: GNVR domain-containing protein [Bacteroidota bacterium]|jgi:uncharacterized protein involved in exopolysaccharide biosynthesis|nr:GNVR domain-containing protein [Bacteroidota bacterium]